MKSTVLTGLDQLVGESFSRLRGSKVAILANAAAVDRNLHHIVDLVHAAKVCEIVRIFAPEHGFRGALQDMETVTDSSDPYTGIPVVSLYGKTEDTLVPQERHLKDIDVLLVDLPDIGTRYYTFAQTMSFAMETAGKTKTKVLALDRPNPIDGVTIEGGALLAGCRSFCGRAPVASRHALTLGELGLLYQRGFGEGKDALPPISCEIEIVKAEGWKREMYWDETGLPWVLPSPNMPTLDTAIVYPGTCLFEATNISEGRGTTRPFELLGAPFIDGRKWVAQTEKEWNGLSGAVLRPASFVPKFQKWGGKICEGIQLHVTDRSTFQPMRWTIALLSAVKKLYPKQFEWRHEAYEFVRDVPAIDLLFGTPGLREVIDSGEPVSGLERKLAEFESWYRKEASAICIYGKM